MFAHVFRERAGHVEGAVQVGVHHPLPGFDRQLGGGHTIPTARSAGIVHQEIHAAEFVDHTREQRIDRLRVADVGDHRQGAAAELADLVGHRFDIAPVHLALVFGIHLRRAARACQDDIATRLRQCQRNRSANAAHSACAGDHRYFAFKTSQRV
ncbi:hypothetical protein D3C78_1551340 [compost metagenome]